MKNNFLLEMKLRGYLNQCTDLEKLDQISNSRSLAGYIGFDCTASSLHVGSLLQIMILRLLQKHGHRPIVLLGGGTTLIGDPSGKDSTRKILKQNNVKKNISGIKKIFEKLLDLKNKRTKPIFVDNFSWLGKLNYIDFLRKVGTQFTLNKMLTYDSVKLRLEREQSLSYMEFNYMILQAYDFYQLFKKNNCILQIGGSDQWGNIVNGVELIKRYSGNQAFGLTTPLITLASGAKMGKTEKGAIWLDSKLLSAYDYWQFWRNTADSEVLGFLKMFTEIELKIIEEIKNQDINKLKIILANEATSMLHGKNKALEAEKTAKDTFEVGVIGKNIPIVKIDKKKLSIGINILDFVVMSNLLLSKSEVRRAIKNKGVKINNDTVNDDKTIINESFFINNLCKLSFGKKKHVVIKMC